MFLLIVTTLWGCPEQSKCTSLPIIVHANQEKILDVQHWPAKNPKKKQTPIYFIAGGPGQSAAALAPLLTPSFSAILEENDMWFLSPLGTQKIAPFDCVTKGSSLEQIFELSDDITHCLPSKNFSPRDYGSESAVHHLERLRQHNKHDRIILYGVSYGTRVAQLYAALYPQNTHSLILDAVLPLDIGVIGSSKPAERILKKHLPSAHEHLHALIKQLPQTLSIYDDEKREKIDITITADILKFMVHGLLYTPKHQEELDQLLEQAQKGNWKILIDTIVTTVDLDVSMGVYFSTFCSEDLPFIKEENAFFPFGAHLLRYCKQWPRYSYKRDYKVPGHIPILILAGNWDPVSPPSYPSILKQGGHKRHWLMWPNQAHVVSFSDCAQKAIVAFLKNIPLSFVLKDECSNIEHY